MSPCPRFTLKSSRNHFFKKKFFFKEFIYLERVREQAERGWGGVRAWVG